MSTEGRLAALDANVSNLNAKIADQNKWLGTLDEKMDKLLLREATREGEAQGMRRSVYIIATLVSTLIAAISWAAPYFVN